MKRLLPLIALPLMVFATMPAHAFSTESDDSGAAVSSGTPHLDDPDAGSAAQFGLDDDGAPLSASMRHRGTRQSQDPSFLGQDPDRGR